MVNIVKKSFNFHLITMRILGFYPGHNYKLLYKLYSYFVFFFMTLPVPTLATVHLLTAENIGLAEVSDSAFLICQVGCFIKKFTPFWINPEKIRNNIYLLQQPLFEASNQEEMKIINDAIMRCKRDCFLNLSLVLSALGSWSMRPLRKHDFKLPIQIWLPYDVASNYFVFCFTYIFVVIGVANGAIASGVIDPLIAGLAYQAAAQLKILKYNLEYLHNYADKNFLDIKNKETKARIMYRKIAMCVRRHNAVIEFVANYEDAYSSVVFTQFLASVLVICNACLQLSMVQPFEYTFFAMILFLVTMLAEIFLFCYYGTVLYEESNSLTDSIYMGNWYEYDRKCQQALILLMERCKKPMIVTAGKILDLSLVTFSTIIRRAYSLLAVLKNY